MMKNSFSQTTTVISHGYNTSGDVLNSWMLQMAVALRERQGDAVIRIYNRLTGNFDYFIGEGRNNILVFNWMPESNDLIEGYSEGAGSALFAALRGYRQGDFNIFQNI